jgi:protein-tyrosine phosphatase
MNSPDPLWRRVARTIRRTPERVLHPWQHARALLSVRALSGPQRLLFVCLGNICRSPYAHYRAAALLAGTEHTVRSGGFVGPGRASPHEAQIAALGRGIDLSPHISGLIPKELVRDSTLIVVMDERQSHWIHALLAGSSANVVLLGDFDPEPIQARAVLDPWKKPLEEFEYCYARIDRCVETLVAALKSY